MYAKLLNVDIIGVYYVRHLIRMDVLKTPFSWAVQAVSFVLNVYVNEAYVVYGNVMLRKENCLAEMML